MLQSREYDPASDDDPIPDNITETEEDEEAEGEEASTDGPSDAV